MRPFVWSRGLNTYNLTKWPRAINAESHFWASEPVVPLCTGLMGGAKSNHMATQRHSFTHAHETLSDENDQLFGESSDEYIPNSDDETDDSVEQPPLQKRRKIHANLPQRRCSNLSHPVISNIGSPQPSCSNIPDDQDFVMKTIEQVIQDNLDSSSSGEEFIDDGASDTSDSDNEGATQPSKKRKTIVDEPNFKLQKADLVPILHDFNHGNSGCQIENIPEQSSALQIFKSFITPEIVQEMQTQTKIYYDSFVSENPEKATNNYKPVDVDEM
ncbi:hypothetical protein FQR65_LT15967 [Abscondita terminalis]|nr:hypothetical protein FQR65_LT15967 [Abscondita terminalis]